LVNARWDDAATGSNYNSSTGVFTSAGKQELASSTAAWTHYVSLVKKPDPNLAQLAGRAYANLGNYSGAAGAWEIASAADPSSAHGFECLAVSAYAAKQTRKGDLALAKALPLTHKLSRATLKSQVQAAKTTPSIAASC
jgi:predicted Zn-dependent protease